MSNRPTARSFPLRSSYCHADGRGRTGNSNDVVREKGCATYLPWNGAGRDADQGAEDDTDHRCDRISSLNDIDRLPERFLLLEPSP